MREDRKRMYVRTRNKFLNPDFVAGVDRFIAFAQSQPKWIDGSKIKCPYRQVKCRIKQFLEVNDVKDHIYRFGFVPNYDIWIWHGETETPNNDEDFEHGRKEVQAKYATKGPEGTPSDLPVEELNDIFLKTMYKHSRGAYLYGTGRNKPVGTFNSTTSKDFETVTSEIQDLKEKLKEMESRVQASVTQAVEDRMTEFIATMSQEGRSFASTSSTDPDTQVSDQSC